MSSHEARVPVPAGRRSAETTGPESASGAQTALSPIPVPASAFGGLTVGHAADPAERQADQLADRALDRLRRAAPSDAEDGAPGAAADTHRHAPGCDHLRRSATPVHVPGAVVGPAGGPLDSGTSEQIESARGGGSPLDGLTRDRLEAAFNAPLGHVRVHRGSTAARLTDAVSAEAFTTGNDIFLGKSATASSDEVLAHEVAHVISEPAGVQRREVRRFFGKLFGKKVLTPEEQKKKDDKKAAADAEAERARKVKQSKKTEKTELAGLKESRKKGEAGRTALRNEIYVPGEEEAVPEGPSTEKGVGPTAQTASAGRMASKTRRFEEALAHEKELFGTLASSAGKGGTLTDQKAADQAFQQTWYKDYPDLESVRPPRETAAERLVIQVRQTRTAAITTKGAVEDSTKEDAEKIKLRMLPKVVEQAYDRMVNHRDELVEKNPKIHPALAQDEASKTVRGSLTDKVLEDMPPRDGALDVAAWQQATARVAARKAQAGRDRHSIETSLALLPEDKRGAKKAELDANPPTGATTEPGALEKGGAVMGDVQKYSGMAFGGINGIGGGIAGQVGKGQDKALRDSAGVTKTSYGPVVSSKLDLGITGAISSGKQAGDWKAKGLVNGPTTKLPTSDATKAKEGIGMVTGILGSLLTAVQSTMQMAQSIEAAWTNNDVYEGIKATKAGAAGLDGLVGAAKNSANLAKLIDSGVSSGVASVIPGLDIASSALGMVRGVMDVTSAGMRQSETDKSMFAARAESGDKVNVTVFPLMKVSQVYTKHLEQACWGLGTNILDFSLAVAQLATAGGYGIPAAIKASAAVVDKIHSVAHYIASKVLNAMAKRAEKDSAVLHVEGGAENELRLHPKMAVDGIVLLAAQGDETAIKFLSNYRVGGKRITADYVKQIKPGGVGPGGKEGAGSEDVLLLTIREAVLGEMDTNADPQSMYDDMKSQLGKVTGVAKKIGDGASDAKKTWDDTGDLAKRRNAMAGKGALGDNAKDDRGVFWRIRMFLSTEKRGKLTQRTGAYEGVEAMPQGIVCAVGDKGLGRGASDSEITAWGDQLTVADLEGELARTPRRNTPEGIEMIRDLLKLKLAEVTSKKTGGDAPKIGSHRRSAPLTGGEGGPKIGSHRRSAPLIGAHRGS